MSEDNLNISQLRQDYPFLNKIWDLYESFDKSVEGSYKGVYEAICENVTLNFPEDKEKYYPFCLKLVRNLDPECENQEVCISPSIRCNNVNSWLYNSKDKKNFNKKYIINSIFQYSGSLAQKIRNYACYYYSYDENYEDPINIIRLKIFDDNMEIIEQTLKDNDQTNNTLCQKYVCECVNIYQKMKKLYCPESIAQYGKRKNTCDMLKALKTPYDTLLSRNPGMETKIPTLEATEDELLSKCPSILEHRELPVGGHSGSSTSSKIPATIGTMAGVSSVFALLYKLTPAGRWINTGLRGSGGRINNSLYTNGVDDLILDGLEHNNFNSYNIGYEAA